MDDRMASRQQHDDLDGDFEEDEDEMGDFIDDDTGEPGQPRRRRMRRPSGAPAGVSTAALNVGMPSTAWTHAPFCVNVFTQLNTA